MKAPTYPTLVFTDQTVSEILERLLKPGTLLITDVHEYPGISKSQPRVQVTEQDAAHIRQVKERYSYTNVVGIGGCTALDFARACAIGKPLYLLPVVLSNACLSTNRSVINYNGTYKTEVTTAPLQTIVSLPEIMKRHVAENNKWAASGFGDLFSALSASVEVEYESNGQSLQNVRQEQVIANVPDCWEAVCWIANLSPDDHLHTPEAYKRLARYLHESSVDVIRKGHTRLNAGSEHRLYYALQEEQQYTKSVATHGYLVSIGTLITLAIYGQSGDPAMYTTMRAANRRLGLPLAYSELEKLGVSRLHLRRALDKVCGANDNLYARYFNDHNFTLVDSIFSD